jgi:hypothetical protein
LLRAFGKGAVLRRSHRNGPYELRLLVT